jgi:hypothetical protein
MFVLTKFFEHVTIVDYFDSTPHLPSHMQSNQLHAMKIGLHAKNSCYIQQIPRT